jgi:hypothetical protein
VQSHIPFLLFSLFFSFLSIVFSFVNAFPPVELANPSPNLNSDSPWFPRRRGTNDVISMPQEPTRVQSHISALQLIVQIVESVALAHDAYETMGARHMRILADGLENAYVFCHSVVQSVLSKDPDYISGIFFFFYNIPYFW